MVKRGREIESLQAAARRRVYEYGAVETLRQLIERGIISVQEVARGVLDVAGSLTRPRMSFWPVDPREARKEYVPRHMGDTRYEWDGSDLPRRRYYLPSNPQYYSGGRSSRIQAKDTTRMLSVANQIDNLLG